MFDADVGRQFALTSAFDIGPQVRYGFVYQPDDQPRPEDAHFLSVGLAFTLRIPEEEPEIVEEVQDTDRDGIVDPEDRCVQTPEDRDGYEDTDGCPDQAPAGSTAPTAVIEEGHITINQRIEFEYDSDVLRAESEPILNEVVSVLRGHPEIRRVRVEGHADERGSAGHNQKLSARRAASVARYLRAHGVTQTIDSQGFGSSRPLCREDSEECHARNRRVEFVILETATGATTAPATAPAPAP